MKCLHSDDALTCEECLKINEYLVMMSKSTPAFAHYAAIERKKSMKIEEE